MLSVTLTMQSRWHVGTGLGTHNGSDSEQFRAANNPAIPGSHLKGIIKDAARAVKDVYGDTKELADAFNRVFGQSGRDDEPGWLFLEAIADSGTETQVLVSRHNRVDPATGRVPAEAFHDRELVELATLTTDIEPPTGCTALERALLAAAVLALEEVGARRRRGLGQVRTDVIWQADGQTLSTTQLLAPLREQIGTDR